MIDFATARVAPEKADFRPALLLRSLPGLNGTDVNDSFKDQYLHPSWQKRRLERLEVAGWACEECDATETTLHVHHRKYVRGRKVWEYADDELQVLCEPCHAKHHDGERLLKEVVSATAFKAYGGTKTAAEDAAILTAGYIAANTCGYVPPETIEACRQRDPFLFYRGVVAHALGLMCAKHGAAVADVVERIYRDSNFPIEGETSMAIRLFRMYTEKHAPPPEDAIE